MARPQPAAITERGPGMSASGGLPVIPYADPQYWDDRYSSSNYGFEWFVGYTALRRVLRKYIPKKRAVLHVGCGASNLQEGMAQVGFTVVNTDISTTLIQQLKAKHAHIPNLSYCVSDCRCMPEFKECSFGSVIDKGTVDALLCCKTAHDNIHRMFSEISRVLQPGGVFLLVTLGDPSKRLHLLCKPEYKWQVSLLLLPKITPDNQAMEGGSPINDSLTPLEVDGPYEVLDSTTVVGLPSGLDPSRFFYAYVCKKHPLQLAAEPGQRLPSDWVTGSREMFEKLQQELGLPPDLLKKGKRTRKLSLREVTARQPPSEQEKLWSQLAARLPRPSSAPSMGTLQGAAQLGLAVPGEGTNGGTCVLEVHGSQGLPPDITSPMAASPLPLEGGASHASLAAALGPAASSDGGASSREGSTGCCSPGSLLSPGSQAYLTIVSDERHRRSSSRASYSSLVAAMTGMDTGQAGSGSGGGSRALGTATPHGSENRHRRLSGLGLAAYEGRGTFLGAPFSEEDGGFVASRSRQLLAGGSEDAPQQAVAREGGKEELVPSTPSPALTPGRAGLGPGSTDSSISGSVSLTSPLETPRTAAAAAAAAALKLKVGQGAAGWQSVLSWPSPGAAPNGALPPASAPAAATAPGSILLSLAEQDRREAAGPVTTVADSGGGANTGMPPRAVAVAAQPVGTTPSCAAAVPTPAGLPAAAAAAAAATAPGSGMRCSQAVEGLERLGLTEGGAPAAGPHSQLQEAAAGGLASQHAPAPSAHAGSNAPVLSSREQPCAAAAAAAADAAAAPPAGWMPASPR